MNFKKHDQKCALLVVDAQESFKAMGEALWKSRGPADFEVHIKSLVTGFRDANQPVYFILHKDDDPGFSTDSPLFRVMDFLEHRPDEPVILKQVHNAFTGSPLLPMLIQNRISRVVICGIRTEQCCETTARVASDLGFDVSFVTQATLTFPLHHPHRDEKMTVDQIQARTEMVLHNRFARIVTVQDVLSLLREEG
ncbi:isochorismatase family protein [Desulfospira joergensenii]|uniref:isochorismatase family protein n=1 Tax=Desulfospira joergensenii TaxID=53329 RepID=UPI0003B4D466|nr:isochorismatase family protein [Desulfospira joergensenii]